MDWKENSSALQLSLALHQHITNPHDLADLLFEKLVESVKINAKKRSTKTKICPVFYTELKS